MRISLDDLHHVMRRLPPHSSVQGPHIDVIVPQRLSAHPRFADPSKMAPLPPSVRFVKETYGNGTETWTDWALDLADAK